MSKDPSNVRDGEVGLEPADLVHFEDPLEVIANDHTRVRAACEVIDRLAKADAPKRGDLGDVIAFMENRLPLVLRDEDDDLHVLLRRRCDAEDEIEKTLVRLRDDHVKATSAMPRLLDALKDMENTGRAATFEEQNDLVHFASALRKHIIVENAIVLPLARFRLTKDDRAELRDHMIARRAAALKG